MRTQGATIAPLSIEKPNLAWQDFALIWFGMLLLLCLIAFETLFASLMISSFLSPIRLLLAFAYILYMPGYCLQAAFFPRQDDLDHIERIGFSIGLSIAVMPLLALLLDRLPWGIGLWPILFGEIGVMGFAMIIALRWRASLPMEEAYAPQWSWPTLAWWHVLPAVQKRIYLLLAGGLLVAGLSVAWIVFVPSPDQFMTEFYILGQEGLAQDYPRQVAPNEEMAVTMGIVNYEREQHRYRVEVWAVDSWADKQELVTQSDPLLLSAGDEQETRLTWAMPSVGDKQKVEFLLFIDDDPTPYRQLRLWLDVIEHKK